MNIEQEKLVVKDIIADNLIALRKKKGVSVSRVQKECFLSATTLHYIEKKSNCVSVEVLVRLAIYYDVSVDQILGLKDL